jgi:hypothetical protein
MRAGREAYWLFSFGQYYPILFMDDLTCMADQFQQATDDIELKEINDYLQAYMLNMLGINCGRYWIINPLLRTAGIRFAKSGNSIDVHLTDFDNKYSTFMRSARWDVGGRKKTLENSMYKIIEKELNVKYPQYTFNIKVTI